MLEGEILAASGCWKVKIGRERLQASMRRCSSCFVPLALALVWLCCCEGGWRCCGREVRLRLRRSLATHSSAKRRRRRG